MVSPVAFSSNAIARQDNVFMQDDKQINLQAIVASHAAFVKLLRERGVHVDLIEEHDPDTPDAVFPNNWLMIHNNVKVKRKRRS